MLKGASRESLLQDQVVVPKWLQKKFFQKHFHLCIIILVVALFTCVCIFDMIQNTQDSNNNNDNTFAVWNQPVIHIVNTRFMQHQGKLAILAKARLYLFQTFSFPTMVKQTNQNFLWIIKTDPYLDEGVKEEMIRMLKPYKNFYLVGSERNLHGLWRGGIASSEVLSLVEHDKFYTGDIELLRAASWVTDERIVLETRLDADDGLNTGFVKQLQERAIAIFNNEKQSLSWFYWCFSSNIEWHSMMNKEIGTLKRVTQDFCVTPGLTLGLNIGTPASYVPTPNHDKLYSYMKKSNNTCGGNFCLSFIKWDKAAIRARTITSAGMKDLKSEQDNKAAWQIITSQAFNITLPTIRQAQIYLQENMIEIAKENRKGQCTAEHSCKQGSKEMLNELIELDQVDAEVKKKKEKELFQGRNNKSEKRERKTITHNLHL